MHLQNANPKYTPVGELLANDNDRLSFNHGYFNYQSAVGMLLYLANTPMQTFKMKSVNVPGFQMTWKNHMRWQQKRMFDNDGKVRWLSDLVGKKPASFMWELLENHQLNFFLLLCLKTECTKYDAMYG